MKSSLVPLLASAATGTCTSAELAGVSQRVSNSRGPALRKALPERRATRGRPDGRSHHGHSSGHGRSRLLLPADGWYAYQLYALETLLVTDKSEERAKVGFTARYKKRMQEAFSTLLVQHRETHVKQTGAVRAGAIA